MTDGWTPSGAIGYRLGDTVTIPIKMKRTWREFFTRKEPAVVNKEFVIISVDNINSFEIEQEHGAEDKNQ